eukprot:1067002-Prorocentrum_minimum.AAC.1
MGELNSPVSKALIRVLMAVWGPNNRAHTRFFFSRSASFACRHCSYSSSNSGSKSPSAVGSCQRSPSAVGSSSRRASSPCARENATESAREHFRGTTGSVDQSQEAREHIPGAGANRSTPTRHASERMEQQRRWRSYRLALPTGFGAPFVCSVHRNSGYSRQQQKGKLRIWVFGWTI